MVLANGSAVLTSGWEEARRAMLECWLSGQAAGGAVADLLLGGANPCGRLAETMPLRLRGHPVLPELPRRAGHVRYGEGVFVGYRGHDALDQAVSYPFGHGLSYTTFGYDDLAVEVTGSHAAGDLGGRGDRRGRPTPATGRARRSCSSTSRDVEASSPGRCAS